MKQFLVRTVIFSLIGLLIFSFFADSAIQKRNSFSRRLPWFRVYERVLTSRREWSGDTLYLGDSVAGQLFPFRYKKPGSLSANGSILICGQFILAANAFESNPGIKRVVLAVVPLTLVQRFESRETYNNFIQPFYSIRHAGHFTPLLHRKMRRKPRSYFSFFNLTKILPLSDIDFQEPDPPFSRAALSDVTIQYLKKLDALCSENNAELILVSPPVMEGLDTISKNWEVLRKQVRKKDLEHIFRYYFNSIRYLPFDSFKEDNVHMSKSYLDKNREKIIREMLPE